MGKPKKNEGIFSTRSEWNTSDDLKNRENSSSAVINSSFQSLD